MNRPVDIGRGTVEEVRAAIEQLTGETLPDVEYEIREIKPDKDTRQAITDLEPLSLTGAHSDVTSWLLSWRETGAISHRVLRFSRLLVEFTASDGMDSACMIRKVFERVRLDAQAQACMLLVSTVVIDGKRWEL